MKINFEFDDDFIGLVGVLIAIVFLIIGILIGHHAFAQTQTEYIIGINNIDYMSNTIWEAFVADGYAKSVLEYPYHANITDLNIHSWFDNIYIGLEVSFMKNIDKGIGYDSDYLYSVLYYKSRFDNTAKINNATFMVGYRFGSTTLYANFNSFKQMNVMTNGYWCIYYSWFWGIIQVNDPIYRLDSHYNIQRNTFGVGLWSKGELNKFISLHANLRYNWLGTIENRGWWNLRKLIFEHNSNRPNLVNLNTGLLFTPIKNIEIGISLYLNYLYAKMTNTVWSEPVKGKEMGEFPVYIKSFNKGISINLYYKGIIK